MKFFLMWLYFPWIGSHTFSAWGFSSAAGLQWKTFFSLSHWHWHFSLFIRHRFDPLPIWVPPLSWSCLFFCIYRAVVIFWCTKIYHFAFSFLSTNKKTVSHLQFMSQLIRIANLMLQQPLRKYLLSNSQVLDLILERVKDISWFRSNSVQSFH